MVTRSNRADSGQRLRTERGAALEARISVTVEGGRFAVYLESRSGALRSPTRRNPDYNEALRYILARLGASEFLLLDATVESTETQALDPREKRLAIGTPYPVRLATEDPEELRLRLTRAQRTIGRPAGSGVGGNNTKRIRLLVAADGMAPSLSAFGELLVRGTDDAVAEAEAAINMIAGVRRGQGFATDSTAKKAVEDRAMDMVRVALEADGWTVKDVSRHESYDYHCRRGDDELRVEVKGSRSTPGQILVTANEARHALEHGDVALAIVGSIKLRRDAGTPLAVGGVITWLRPWAIGQGTLVPLAYSWRVPEIT
jgi:Domain of unknown function (DUF3883)